MFLGLSSLKNEKKRVFQKYFYTYVKKEGIPSQNGENTDAADGVRYGFGCALPQKGTHMNECHTKKQKKDQASQRCQNFEDFRSCKHPQDFQGSQNSQNCRNSQNAKSEKNSKSQDSDKLPAGTPKQKSPYGEEKDPPVPNRAHTEM